MGVLADNINFGTFDMLKDLEIARHRLHAKSNEPVVIEIIDEENDEDDINTRLIEWLQDDLSETERDILGKSKKKGRLPERKVKIAPKNKRYKQDQEAPGLEKRAEDKSDPQLPNPRQKRRKKMTIQDLIWNCRGLKKKGVSTYLKNLVF